MDFVAGSAGQPAALVLAPVPVAALAILVAADAGLDDDFRRGRTAFGEVHVHRRAGGSAFGVLDVRNAGSVAGLAARGACVRLHAMRGLVDGQPRLGFCLIVAASADRAALQRAVRSEE